VNPPRRGIGEDLAGWLESSGTRHVLYSSCNNVSSLARDLERMPSLRPRRALLLDMSRTRATTSCWCCWSGAETSSHSLWSTGPRAAAVSVVAA
jgi:hypothetical protein